MSNEGLVECVVERKGLMVRGKEIPVGSTIELTPRQVKAFVNKVRPVSELKVGAPSSDNTLMQLDQLEKENAELKEELELLREELSLLKEELGEAPGEDEESKTSSKKSRKSKS